MKQTHLFIAKGFALVWVWMFTQPALAEFLTFGGIQKDDMNDPGQHDWIASGALSPDAKHVYMANNNDSVAVFSRDEHTGKLAFMEALRNGSDGVKGLFSLRFLTTSTDGRHIYVSGKSNNLKPETVILTTSFAKGEAKEFGIAEQIRAVRPGENIQIETV